MANPFYNYSGAFIAGTLARAEAEAAEFTAVQNGFSALVTQGIDSGVVNAYVVTTLGQPTGSYVDGTTVEFKPLVTNTGASTLSVNAIPAANILRFNGAALLAGDLIAGVWATATYNSTLGAFTLVGPGQTAVIPGSISAAPPTNKVGLTAAGGSSTQAVPIDATYAIDQSIAPTWTGVHTFSNKPVMNAGLTVTGAAITSSAGLTVSAGSVIVGSPTGAGQGTGTINATGLFINGVAVVAGSTVSSITGTANQITASASTGAVTLALSQNVVLPAPPSGTTLAITGVSGGAAMTIDSSGATASGLTWKRNTISIGDIGSGDFVVSGGAAADFGLTSRGGQLLLGSNSLTRIAIANAGNVTINAPSSGTTLLASGSAIQFASKTTVARGSGSNLIDFQDPTGESGYIGYGGANSNFNVQNLLAGSLTLGTNNATMVTIASGGAVTIAVPTSGSALTTNGLAGSDALTVKASSSSGNSFGAIISGGTTSADNALRVFNQATTVPYLQVFGDGGVTVGSPTGGGQGLGTINVASSAGLYTNGVALLQTGSFTGTMTGLTSTPTATFNWRITGNMCTVWCNAGLSAVSNAITCTITGVSSAITTTTSSAMSANCIVQDNGSFLLGICTAASNVFTLAKAGGGSFTNVGAKGIPSGWCITYAIS